MRANVNPENRENVKVAGELLTKAAATSIDNRVSSIIVDAVIRLLTEGMHPVVIIDGAESFLDQLNGLPEI